MLAQTTLLPTSVSGGTGTAADVQANDKTSYAVAKSAVASVGGFGTTSETISSVYLMLEYGVEAGYSGTNAIQVNGINTSIVPANGEGARAVFIDITGGSFSIDTSAEIDSMTVGFTNNHSGSGGAVRFDYVHVLVNPELPIHTPPTWFDEFDGTGPADPDYWWYEQGYQRNNEDQYYTSNNGWQEGGLFIIEAREEVVTDPQDGTFNYTSSSIRSKDRYSWQYGRAQIRAKVPALAGMWPAIWTVGDVGEWPYNGECDIMEYYQNKILANCAVGSGERWTAKWDASNRTMDSLLAVDPNWKNEYHIWTMQWDESNVRLYCDNILMNTIPQSWLVNNGSYGGSPDEPFKQPHSAWLNLAIGGNAGGDPSGTTFPQRYLIDYWRVWEGVTDNSAPTDIALSNGSVSENLPAGSVVGTFSVTDPDPAEVIRYSLVAGTGDTHNHLFSIPEFTSDSTDTCLLKTAAVLNYDNGATRSIRVRATDIEGATFDKVMTISVVPDADILVSTTSVDVAEGGTQTFDVKLRYLPASDITVHVSNSSGDADISILSGSSLTFTPTNGTTWQQVTLSAAEDGDVTNGVATILCEDPGATYASATVSATEIDNDNLSPEVEAGLAQTVYLSGSGGGASVTLGADVSLDASLEADTTNNIWDDAQGSWSPSIDPEVSFVEDAGSGYQGISKAYDFPGGLSGTGGLEGLGLQDMGLFEDTGTGRDRLPISLEIWFKPDASASYPAKGQVLWETGGGTGFGIFYDGTHVVAAHDSYQGAMSADVSGLTTEFIQVVVTYDTLATADSFSLYINGAHAATTSRDDPDMCGGDNAGLGKRGESNVGGAGGGDAETTSFDGQIAIFRSYYNQILSATEVQANYDAIAGELVEATLDASVTDPNGEPTTVSWTLVSGPGAVRFADASSVDTTASFGLPGSYILQLTADDGTSLPGSDQVEITVSAPPLTVDIAAAEISENGGSTTATVSRLSSSGELVVNLSSSDTGEATVPTSITILDGQTTSPSFNIDAVDDALVDGTQTVTITASASGHEDGTDTVDVTDDELAGPGFQVSAISGDTTEAGGTATFTVVLNTQPTAEVTIGLSSSDTSEGLPSPASLTFTDANWDTPQSVTVTGQDDAVADGDVAYGIVTGAASSSDGNYNGLNPADVSVTNLDNDFPGFLVSAISANTTENGGTATFTIAMNTEPTADVTVGIASSDSGEGTPSPASLTFNTTNWDTPQTVTVTGVDDSLDDGDVVYSIITAAASSTDSSYDGINPDDISVTNADDDFTLGVVAGTGGDSVTGGGVVDEDLGPYAITATAASGYSFANWSVTSGTASFADASSASTDVTASADATVQANFTPDTYVVTYHANGADSGTIPADQNKSHDIDLTLATNSGNLTRSGFTFTGWNTAADGTGTDYAAGATYTLNEPVTLYANWKEPSGITFGSATRISSNTNFNLSVFPGKARYSGDASGAFGDGTVEAYALAKNTALGGSYSEHQIGFYASGGTSITIDSYGGATTFADFDRGDVWTGSDPDTAAADYGGTTETISGGHEVSGTIDIANYQSGTVYVMLGSYEDPFDLSLTMSGSGQTPIAEAMPQIDPPPSRNIYVVEFTFDNAAKDYDSITYAYTGSTSGRARFMGVVVDGATAPSYSVTYNGNGSGGGTVPTDSNRYQGNDTVTVLGNTGSLTRAGYSFGGWNTAADGSGTTYKAADTFPITADTTLYAVWVEDFATWIANYEVGGLTGFSDDSDGDGLSNGIENYLGTDPSAHNAGITLGTVTPGVETTLTFTHPLNDSPAGDLVAAYTWAKDLATFHADGQTDADGTTVTFVQSPPSDGQVTATATVTGTVAPSIFVRIEVSQSGP
ncbi:MAG: InlB B-repeat-containing protein [Akkermansiaceae bacterium]|nr:InlB B-repeat-containing protein [Akkermansiaceae bacterium]